MPSSMCWPCRVSRQRTSVSVSSPNQSMRSPRAQIPARLIQPPRLVDEATSGLTVTMRAATSGASCERSTSTRPSACWVETRPACVRPSSTGGDGGASGADTSRRSRSAVAVHSSASALPSGGGRHGSSHVGGELARQLLQLPSVSRAEWLLGWPAIGSPQPLIV